MTDRRCAFALLLAATLGLLAGCAEMTPAQKEAAEFRKSCEPNPLADPERCYVFINVPGG
jgi:hypothetical protein